MSLYPEQTLITRTPEHIDRLLGLLRAAWLCEPQLRFEQITSLVCDDYHYTPDDVVEVNLQRRLAVP